MVAVNKFLRVATAYSWKFIIARYFIITACYFDISAHLHRLLQLYCLFSLITTAENRLFYQLLYHYCGLQRNYLIVTAWLLHTTTSLLSHYNVLLRNNGFITTCYYVVIDPFLLVTTVVIGSLLLIA